MSTFLLDDEADFEQLRRLAQSVEAADHERTDPPAFVWDGIEEYVRQDKPMLGRAARVPSVLLAAAAVLVAVLLVGVGLNLSTAAPELVATAQLSTEGLPVATTAQAEVNLVELDDGFALDIDLTRLPDAADGQIELWIINEDVSDMHSLGVVTSSGRYALPISVVDPADFPIVDMSIEPEDGDPTHSGQSTLRGRLSI